LISVAVELDLTQPVPSRQKPAGVDLLEIGRTECTRVHFFVKLVGDGETFRVGWLVI
jgi:hypothetical protein